MTSYSECNNPLHPLHWWEWLVIPIALALLWIILVVCFIVWEITERVRR